MKYEVKQLKSVIKTAIAEKEDEDYKYFTVRLALTLDIVLLVFIPAFWLMSCLVLIFQHGQQFPAYTASYSSVFILMLYVVSGVVYQFCKVDFRKKVKLL